MNVKIRKIVENMHRHRTCAEWRQGARSHNQQAARSSAHEELWQKHDERKSYKITCKQSYHAQYFYHKQVRGSDDIERAAVLKYVTRPFMAVLLMKVIVVVLFSGFENDDWLRFWKSSRMPDRLSTCFANTWQLRGWEDFESPGLSLYWWKIKIHGFDWLS